MDARLFDLLRSVQSDNVVDEKEEFTHITIYSGRMRWTVASDRYDQFWGRYCELATAQAKLCLAERPKPKMPVIIDCILRFPYTDDYEDRLYNDRFLLSLVHCCQFVIHDLLQPSQGNMNMICCVLEGESYIESNKERETRELAQKIRLQFPYCKTDVKIQLSLLYPAILKMVREMNAISHLPQQPLNDWETILTPQVQEPVLMYGSSDRPELAPLVLTHIWPSIPALAIEQEESATELQLGECFRRENHSQVNEGLITPTLLSRVEGSEFWLPLFLSVDYWSKLTHPKPDMVHQSPRSSIQSEHETPLDLARQLLPLLKRERAATEAYWLDVGRALYNCDKGGDEGMESWIAFTEQHDVEREEEECQRLYPTFQISHLSVKTIAWYAREDSPDQYKKWHDEWCGEAMNAATTGHHDDVAKALHKMYWLDFVCAGLTSSLWYQFRDHRWVEQDEGIGLSRLVGEDFLKRFERDRARMTIKITEVDQGSGEKLRLEALVKDIGKLIKSLKNIGYKSSIMRCAKEHFYQEGFRGLLNSNPDYTGMLNCVIETCGAEAVVRSGKPEDFVSMCSNIAYMRHMNDGHPDMKRLMKWLGQVFVDPDLKHHFLKDAASMLKGRNSEKLFRVWTGANGNNSKSMIIKLFQAAFGMYCIDMPVSLVSGKTTQSSSATPELARARGSKIAIMSEPDEEESMKNGTIKRYTGGDRFFTRMLHDNGGDMEATFKLIMVCNRPPAILNADTAGRKRSQFLPFLSTWTEEAPDNEAEQYRQRKFKMDEFFERQIPVLAHAFIWKLVQYYPKYIKEGLNTPAIVKEVTNQYWMENDVYQQFVEDNLIQVYKDPEKTIVDTGAALTQADLYRAFKDWYRDCFPGAKIANSTVVKDEMIKRIGKQTQKRWHGVRLVEQIAQI